MLKFVLVLGLATVCMYTLDASVISNVRALHNTPNQLNANGISKLKEGFLCKCCIEFWSAVKDAIGDVRNLTKDGLENALKTVCKDLEGTLPFIDEICDDFGPEFIDFIYKYLTEIDDDIVPEHDCKMQFMCWGDNQDAHSAFQKLILKHRVKFD